MDHDERLTKAAGTQTRDRSGMMTRREGFGLLAGLGLAAAGAVAIGTRTTGAKPAARAGVAHAGHGGFHAGLLRQDAGTPAPVATPVLGEQPDGSHIWRVRVAGMDM